MYYVKVVQQDEESLVRRVTLSANGFKPKDWKPKRRVGRPCHRWVERVFDLALSSFGGELGLAQKFDTLEPTEWRSILRKLQF